MKRRLSLLLTLLLLTGCAAPSADPAEPEATLPVPTAIAGSTAAPAPITAPAEMNASIDTKEMDFTFTQRELAGTYEAHETVDILGSGQTAEIRGKGAALSGGTLTISKEGMYRLTGEFNGIFLRIAVDEQEKVQLVLDNAQITNPNGPAIYIQSADKVFITIPGNTQSSVSDGSSYSLEDGGTAVDGAIFSRSDLCLNGTGTLTVTGQCKHGVVSKDDLVITGMTLEVKAVSTALDGKDCVKVSGASIHVDAGSNGVRSDNAEDASRGFVYLQDTTLTVNAGSDGVQAQTVLICESSVLNITAGGGSGSSLHSADGSWKGLKSGGDMYFSGGSCTISSRDDCIHSNSSIVIADGSFDLSSGDDGVHADTNLTISGGSLLVSKSYEGLEASKLVISGGRIEVTASDDGLNAAGGADGSALGMRFGRGMFSNGVGEIEITGGYTVINAKGDGIDSNSSIRVSGGVTLVSGPVSSGNAAFDYDGEATVTGGVLIATGAAGMAQNFSSAENQGAMLVSFSPMASRETIALTDANGLVLASFTPVNPYQSAVITAPGIQEGQTYTLLTGCTVTGADDHGFAQNTTTSGGVLIDQITMSSLLYGGGQGMRNRPGGGPGGMPGGNPGGRPRW